ncbi:superoxide dismutase family protein [Paenibacillus xerothermodurans]|uniref:Superoxide dismutase family protein n=1 Tax=Paenibacillus xerothermodurans TaxID=1977292 RepID=A0A2W1P349_PAEXE|nr:superoxide dismutase family protein [Paenibacillus xerothermodurans]PZE22122.1 superoxide dismutase family protein [Paenibacillus xerothermodurans]
MKKWSRITPAVILALSLSMSGCATGEQTTSGNQNTGNPSSSGQNSSSDTNSSSSSTGASGSANGGTGAGSTSGSTTGSASSSTSSGGNGAGTVQQGTPQSSPQGTPSAQASDQPIKLEIKDTKMASLGTAELKKHAEGVEIKLNVSGLTPGKHGIHIHQFAKCEGPDFKSAGDHFNPEQKKHGLEQPDGGHAGDLPNIEADANGSVNATLISKTTTLDTGKTNSLLGGDGKSLIIHAKEDDGKTDPSGNSGDRVACAVMK